MTSLLLGLLMYQPPPQPLLDRMGVVRTGKNGAELFIDAVDALSQREHTEAVRWLLAGPGEPRRVPYGLPADVSRTTVRQRIAEVVLTAHRKVVEGNRMGFSPLRQRRTYETLFPEFAGLRTATLAVSVTIQELYARGDGRLAMGLLREWTLALDRYPEPTLIAFLVKVACHAILIARVEPLIRNLSRADAEILIQMQVPMLEGSSILSESLRGEREFLQQWNDSPDLRDSLGEEGTPPPSPAQVRAAVAITERHTDNLLAVLTQPESTWFSGTLLLEEELEVRAREDRAADLAIEMIPLGSPVVQTFLRLRTQWRLLRLAARAQIYFWEHDRLPATLTDFVPEAEKTDPINGKPFVYRNLEHRFEVESAGIPGRSPITIRTRGIQSPPPQTP